MCVKGVAGVGVCVCVCGGIALLGGKGSGLGKILVEVGDVMSALSRFGGI